MRAVRRVHAGVDRNLSPSRPGVKLLSAALGSVHASAGGISKTLWQLWSWLHLRSWPNEHHLNRAIRLDGRSSRWTARALGIRGHHRQTNGSVALYRADRVDFEAWFLPKAMNLATVDFYLSAREGQPHLLISRKSTAVPREPYRRRQTRVLHQAPSNFSAWRTINRQQGSTRS